MYVREEKTFAFVHSMYLACEVFILIHVGKVKMFKSFYESMVNWFRSLFWKQEMELTLVGLQNSGKTTLVNVVAVSR